MTKFKYEIRNQKYMVCEDIENRYVVYEIKEELLSDRKVKGIYKDYLQLLSYEQDIEYAKAYVEQMFFSKDTSLIDGALINGAIQLLVKCFTNPSGKGRPGMDPTKVFHNYATEIGEKSYLKQYNQFYEARKTVIAHDQKDYLENKIGLTVDRKTCIPIEITYIKQKSHYLYKQNAEIMQKMLDIVLKYIQKEKIKREKILLDYFMSVSQKELNTYKEFKCDEIELSNVW